MLLQSVLCCPCKKPQCSKTLGDQRTLPEGSYSRKEETFRCQPQRLEVHVNDFPVKSKCDPQLRHDQGLWLGFGLSGVSLCL